MLEPQDRRTIGPRSPTEPEDLPALLLRAGRLQKSGTAATTRMALALLERLVREASDLSQLAAAHAQRAACLRALGRSDEAVMAFRAAFTAERSVAQLHQPTYLEFAEFVLTLDQAELFREALAALEEFGAGENFPIEGCRAEIIRTRLHEALGEHERARWTARRALARLARAQSALRDEQTTLLAIGLDFGTHRHGPKSRPRRHR